MPEVARALALFVLASLAEIGGGWLVWQFLRESRPWPFGVLGALVLISYGVIVTFEADPHFGCTRRTAASSLSWRWPGAMSWTASDPIVGTSAARRSA